MFLFFFVFLANQEPHARHQGQFYSVKLTDMESYDGILTSTLTLMFHEESHRRVSGNYWRFWFGQQKDPQTSRAIDISNGIQNVQHDKFDRVTFDWNGRRGASIHVRFNCLSTDFSRIKGVKGIPLRLHMETSQAYASLYPTHPAVYCKIKLFRDKGAERKNKDDTRQLERQMEKLRGKHGKMHHPLWLAHQRAQPFTVFSEIPECLSPPTPIVHHHPSPTLTSAPGPSSSLFLHNHAAPLASPPSSVGAAAAATASGIFTMPLTPPRGIKRSVGTMLQQDDGLGHSSTRGMLMMANGDPSYSPFVQRRVASKVSFFIVQYHHARKNQLNYSFCSLSLSVCINTPR
ncbi:CP2 transcription factor-domain-containing protein [Dichotomocladium elegans]|nr:CP2 transcription factor-domain-containing protein [Dichotomocladium elegans]